MSDTTTRESRVGVLGPLTVSASGADADLGGPKQRLLLAVLLADIDHVGTAYADLPNEPAIEAENARLIELHDDER